MGEQQQQPTNTESNYRIFHFEKGLMLDVGVMFAHLAADDQLNLLYYGVTPDRPTCIYPVRHDELVFSKLSHTHAPPSHTRARMHVS